MTDFDELFGPVEKARCHLESVWNSISLFHLVSDSLDRYRFAQLQARGERALNERYHSSDVYKTLVAIANDQDKKLDDESRRLLDRHLQEYRHRGFEVSSNKEEAMEKTKVTGLYKARRQYNFKMMVRRCKLCGKEVHFEIHARLFQQHRKNRMVDLPFCFNEQSEVTDYNRSNT